MFCFLGFHGGRPTPVDANVMAFTCAGQGSVKDLAEARDRRSDIQVAVRDNERELAKYKVREILC